jgi:hypothetical protein
MEETYLKGTRCVWYILEILHHRKRVSDDMLEKMCFNKG